MDKDVLDRNLSLLMAREVPFSNDKTHAIIQHALSHRQRHPALQSMNAIIGGLFTPWPVGLLQKTAFLALIAAAGFGIGFQQQMSAQGPDASLSAMMDGGDRGIL